MRLFLFLSTILLCTSPSYAHAAVVVSEVLWMGSDQSSADEWIELTCVPDEETLCPVDISSWIMTSRKNSIDEPMIQIPFGYTVDEGEFLLISNYDAESSRLAIEPDFVDTSVSLPNSGLLLLLTDADGNVVDAVDDGSGKPFAGENTTGSPKASMERIDLTKPGTDPGNWRSATESINLDEGELLFATPGEPPSISFSSSSSFSSTSSLSGSGETLCTEIDPVIVIQSGQPTGDEKVTINLQADLGDAPKSTPCTWDYGDGYTSESCNPPSHSFREAGSYTITLSVPGNCSTTVTQTLDIQVRGKASNASAGSSSSARKKLGREDVVLAGAYVNAPGYMFEVGESSQEWIALHNRDVLPIRLLGWMIEYASSPKKRFSLDAMLLQPGEVQKLSAERMGFSLRNAKGIVYLRDALGEIISTIEWKDAKEGRIITPDGPESGRFRGRVLEIDALDTVTVKFEDVAHVSELLPYPSAQKISLAGIEPEMYIPLGNTDKNLLINSLKTLLKGKEIELEMSTKSEKKKDIPVMNVYLESGETLTDLLKTEIIEIFGELPTKIAHVSRMRSSRSASSQLSFASSSSFSSSASSQSIPQKIDVQNNQIIGLKSKYSTKKVIKKSSSSASSIAFTYVDVPKDSFSGTLESPETRQILLWSAIFASGAILLTFVRQKLQKN